MNLDKDEKVQGEDSDGLYLELSLTYTYIP